MQFSYLIILLFCFSLLQTQFVAASTENWPKKLTLALPFDDVDSSSTYATRIKEIYQEIFRPFDVNLEFVHFPTKRSLRMSDSGEIDGETARIGQLLDHQLVTNLLRVEPYLCFVAIGAYGLNQQKVLAINSWEDLQAKGLRVGVQRGMLIWSKKLKAMGVETVLLDTIDQGIKLLKMGRIELIIGPVHLVETIASTSGNNTSLEKYGELDKQYLYFWLHKKHERLIAKINKRWSELREDPTFARKHFPIFK